MDALLTMADVAKRLHKSRRWLHGFIRRKPFYRLAGRTKLFTEEDYQRIVEALPATERDVQYPPWARELLRSARQRATKAGMPFTLAAPDMIEMVRRADGRCEMTRIEFDFAKSPDHFHRPFAPSIDRIKSDLGYTPDNVRLVAVAVNIAMKQWGDQVLMTIARALVAR